MMVSRCKGKGKREGKRDRGCGRPEFLLCYIDQNWTKMLIPRYNGRNFVDVFGAHALA